MYAYEDRLKAIKLYFKYESYAAVINELGYPSRGALKLWIGEYKRKNWFYTIKTSSLKR